MIMCNGEVMAHAKQFDVHNVEIITATIDLDNVLSYRTTTPSFNIQTVLAKDHHKLDAGSVYVQEYKPRFLTVSSSSNMEYHTLKEDCRLGPACWMWDYMWKSRVLGFFLLLSGE